MAQEALDVAKKRKANGANLDTSFFGMVKHAHGELVEVVEEFCRDTDREEKLLDEISDVIMCCLIMARQI
jgi:NTP pyrophosphatase (non-canonical NTP hydrolase)